MESRILLNCQKVERESAVSESLKLNTTLKSMLNDIRPNLLPKVLVMALITKRPFHLFLKMTILEL